MVQLNNSKLFIHRKSIETRCVSKSECLIINSAVDTILNSIRLMPLRFPSDNCSWTLVTSGSEAFPPRAGHTSAYIEALDAVVTFGGKDLNEAFNDLVIFTLAEGNDGNNGWRRLQQRC